MSEPLDLDARAELIALRNDALNMRGALSPNGFPRRVPMELGAELAPAVEWLLAEVERLRSAVELLGRSAQADSQDIIDTCRDLVRAREDIADAARQVQNQMGDPAALLRELAARHAPARGGA